MNNLKRLAPALLALLSIAAHASDPAPLQLELRVTRGSDLYLQESVTSAVGKTVTIEALRKVPYNAQAAQDRYGHIETTKAFFDTGVEAKLTPVSLSEDGGVVDLDARLVSLDAMKRLKGPGGIEVDAPQTSTHRATQTLALQYGTPVVYQAHGYTIQLVARRLPQQAGEMPGGGKE